jgi:hypothetical protein
MLVIASCVLVLAFVLNTLLSRAPNAGQTKRGSVMEVLLNIAIGYGISYTANAMILPMYGFTISHAQNLQIGVIFTAISVVRGYYVRRLFNYLWVKGIIK